MFVQVVFQGVMSHSVASFCVILSCQILLIEIVVDKTRSKRTLLNFSQLNLNFILSKHTKLAISCNFEIDF